MTSVLRSSSSHPRASEPRIRFRLRSPLTAVVPRDPRTMWVEYRNALTAHSGYVGNHGADGGETVPARFPTAGWSLAPRHGPALRIDGTCHDD